MGTNKQKLYHVESLFGDDFLILDAEDNVLASCASEADAALIVERCNLQIELIRQLEIYSQFYHGTKDADLLANTMNLLARTNKEVKNERK